MRIANNVTAMNTHRQYAINNTAIGKSAEKLSSGYRVNRAADDAAGLAISEKMRSQIRGLNMASKNSQDGNSLIQTAEGALQEMHSVLQRMNELAVQSATDTNQNLDRNALDQEFQQLIEEINDIATQTTFNDMQLLNGDFKVQYATTLPALGAGWSNPVLQNLKSDAAVSLAITNAGTKADTVTINVGANEYKVSLNDIMDNVVLTDTATDVALKDGESVFIDLTAYGLGSYEFTNTTGANMTGNDLAVEIAAKLVLTNAAATAVTDNPLSIQVGAKEGNLMDIGIDELNAATLGLTGRNIASQATAGRAISIVRSATNQVSMCRGALGAAQNRLEHKIANLDNQAENLQAAESRIRDVDMASEMTNFTKNSILSQAATAMLAQANALPQNVLQLLS